MKMNKKVLLILSTLFCSSIVTAQINTFEYSYTSPNDLMIYDIYENYNGSIYFCGGSSTTLYQNNSSLFVKKIDQYGNSLDSLLYSIEDKSLSAIQLLPTDTNDFVLCARMRETLLQNPAICFYNIDNELNLSAETMYYLNNDYDFQIGYTYSEILNNGNIFSSINVSIFNTAFRRVFIYLLDANFDSINSVYYPSDFRGLSHHKELPDSNIWSVNHFAGEYEIYNQDLELLESQKIPELFQIGDFGVVWDSDSSFFMLGKTYIPGLSNPDNLGYIRQFHPMDTTGYLFNYWRYSDTIDYPGVYNGIDLNNKDTVFIGGTENLYVYNPYYANQPSWFVILQTDSLLNKRWERFYGGDAYYVMNNLIATNDGGCIVAGTRYDYLNAPENMLDIVILKLDSNGLITNMEETEESKFSEAIVYPNPGITEMNIKVAAQHNVSTFALYDISGNLVLSKEIHGNNHTINTNHLRQGSYIYTITNNNGLNETGIWIKK